MFFGLEQMMLMWQTLKVSVGKINFNIFFNSNNYFFLLGGAERSCCGSIWEIEIICNNYYKFEEYFLGIFSQQPKANKSLIFFKEQRDFLQIFYKDIS